MKSKLKTIYYKAENKKISMAAENCIKENCVHNKAWLKCSPISVSFQ